MRNAPFRLAAIATAVVAMAIVATGTATAGSNKVTSPNTLFYVYFTSGSTPTIDRDEVTVSRNLKAPSGKDLYEVCTKLVSPNRCSGEKYFVYERTAVGEPWYPVGYAP